MIRAFVALSVPPVVAASLEAAQAGLPCGRPVPRENFHLTLAFLGEHPEPVVEDAHLALESVSAEGFELELSGVGSFGGDQPRAIFAEVAANPGLAHLRKKVSTAMRNAGLQLEHKKFHPHVTLARFNRRLDPEATADLHRFLAMRVHLRTEPFQVSAFHLYRSTLGKEGPYYEILADYPLRGNSASA